MAEPHFAMKDKRLLDALNQDPRQSLSAIAKKLNTSVQVIDYHLKKLLKQDTIYHFYTFIDVGMLGYTSYRAHIKLGIYTKEAYDQFINDLFHHYPTFWVGFISGSFDIIADIFAKNPHDFDNLFKQLLKKHKDIIRDYEFFPLLELDIFSYASFTGKTEKKRFPMHRSLAALKLDQTDKQLLKLVKNNCRKTYHELGEQVGLTRNAIKYRLQKLQDAGIIKGHQILIDYTQFDKHSYKVFIKYDTAHIEQEKELINYLQATPGVLSIAYHIGRWNIDVEIHLDGPKELQNYLISLRNEFAIVANYEFVELLDDYGIDFFPDALLRE